MKNLVIALNELFADATEFSPRQIASAAEKAGVDTNEAYKYMKSFPKVRRGIYDMAGAMGKVIEMPVKQEAPLKAAIQSIVNEEVYVPEKNDCYVAWGNSKDIESIVKSKIFYPTYISGLSGNGKTTMVEQACAKLNREYVRVQITPETDEDDLLGGFRLINGETVFSEGPVVKAMKAGALLLIDEIDRGSNKIMCLQGVLEGKPIMIKKTGQVVTPANGFNVIATANTKGRGSEDGKFIAATIIDEAFLERFTITIEQAYPSLSVERKIVMKHMEKFECVDENFAEMLVQWSETIRKTYADGGIDELISTRRLCHIVQTFAIFGKRDKAIELCINRFDEDVKDAFMDLYSKVDASLSSVDEQVAADMEAAKTVDREEAIDNILNNL